MPIDSPDELTFIIAVDHRVDICTELLEAAAGQPSAAAMQRASELKDVVFAGLMNAVEAGVPKSQAGLWSESNIGEAALLRARAINLKTAVSIERPRVAEFQLEDALGFAAALKRLAATYAGTRVFYNPDGDVGANQSQRLQLRRITEISRSEGPRLLLELNVLPTDEQREAGGKLGSWERQVRPALLVRAIRDLQDAGIEPHVWAFEPPMDPTAAATIVAQAFVDDRQPALLFAVGNDSAMEPKSPVHDDIAWLAARTPGVSGLVIGPAAYYRYLASHAGGDLTRDAAVAAISERFRRLRSLFTEARRTSNVP
jgi:5-dehydro-2-deoxygluconokinase